ncbi:MAG: glycosyltransferase [Planctomycetota bacterium]|jgi:glycosyltransferase involved in cell wall biosynthesis
MQNAVSKDNILVVVPVYNHGGTIHDVVSRCLKFHSEVLVVDDGSDEDVSVALGDLDVKIIRHERNRGKGIITRRIFLLSMPMVNIIPSKFPIFLKA